MSNIAVLASVTAHIECACFDRQEFTQAPEANDSQLWICHSHIHEWKFSFVALNSKWCVDVGIP